MNRALSDFVRDEAFVPSVSRLMSDVRRMVPGRVGGR
jgi:hypothetical protein